MQEANGPALYVDAVSTFRKYEKEERGIIVGSMTWLLPTEGLEFEGKYWSIISSSTTDPTHSTVVRICYRLQVTNASTQPIDRTQRIMNCIGKQVRYYLQLQQDAFLDQADAVQGS